MKQTQTRGLECGRGGVDMTFNFAFEKPERFCLGVIKTKLIQANLIVTRCLASMKTDCVISEPCYNDVIYNRHITRSPPIGA